MYYKFLIYVLFNIIVSGFDSREFNEVLGGVYKLDEGSPIVYYIV